MFGDEIRKLCSAKQITQKEAAEGIGIKLNRFNNYINNHSEPDLETLVKVAKFFNVSVDSLLGLSLSADTLTEQEADLLSTFRQLDRRGRYKALAACMDELDHMKLREKEAAEERAKSLVSAG